MFLCFLCCLLSNTIFCRKNSSVTALTLGRMRSPHQVLWFRVKYNARRKLLRSTPGGRRKRFEVCEIALPGRVHHAAEAFCVVLAGVEPVADAFGRGVGVGKDLRMASLGELLTGGPARCSFRLAPVGDADFVVAKEVHPLHVAAWPSFRPRFVAGRGVAAKSCSASRTYRKRRLPRQERPGQVSD